MNRRELLAATGALTIVSFVPKGVFAQATPAAEGYPTLQIDVQDDGYTLPATVPAGRTFVTVSNKGTQGSHTSLGRVPEGTTKEDILAANDQTDPNAPAPDWFWKTTWVGLPDWPKPGESVTGIVDLQPGLALVLNPIGDQQPSVIEITGTFTAAPEPQSDATVMLGEMTITLPAAGLKSGKQRVKIENKGAVEHEFAVLPLPAGMTKQQIIDLFMLPEDATPAPDQPVIDYAPIAACSILSESGTTWIDIDLPAGHYAAICMLPDQTTGIPHGLMGMLDVFDVK